MASSRNQSRRRRVVFDEAIQKAAKTASSAASASPIKRPTPKRKYSNQARRNRDLTDFIPKRWLPLTACTAILLLCLSFLNALDWVTTLPQFPRQSHAASILSLTSPTGLARWFNAVCFCGIAVYGLLIYGLRQYRRDDYRGTYRVWGSMALLALLASIHSVVDLDRAFFETVNLWMHQAWLAPDSMVLASIRWLAITVVAVRLLIEVRHSKLSVFFCGLAVIAAGLAVGLKLPSAQRLWIAQWPNDSANLTAIAAASGLLTVLSFSRYVYRDIFGMRRKSDAEGPVGKKTRSEKQARQKSTRTTGAATPSAPPLSSSPTRATPAASGLTDKPSVPSKPSGPLSSRLNLGGRSISTETVTVTASGAGSVTTTQANAGGGNAGDNALASDHRLSKAERKRLKRQQRQDRRAA